MAELRNGRPRMCDAPAPFADIRGWQRKVQFARTAVWQYLADTGMAGPDALRGEADICDTLLQQPRCQPKESQSGIDGAKIIMTYAPAQGASGLR